MSSAAAAAAAAAEDPPADPAWLAFCMFTYFVASSTMLLVNKIVFTMLPVPALVVTVQYVVTALIVLGLGRCRVVDVALPSLGELKQYMVIPLLFSSAIFFNGKMLELANVETFLVFRFATPLCVAVIDFLLMGKTLPAPRSLLAFVGIIAGGIGYALSDEGFLLESYLWAAAYLVVICAEMIVVKHVFNKLEMSSWTRVFLNNALSLPFQPLFMLLTHEWERYHLLEFNVYSVFTLVLSSLLGLALAWSGTELRARISATSFTLTGVVCKIVTVLVNFLMWDRHANTVGTVSLLVCLAGATAYVPAQTRDVEGFSHRAWLTLNNAVFFKMLQHWELEPPAVTGTAVEEAVVVPEKDKEGGVVDETTALKESNSAVDRGSDQPAAVKGGA